LLFDDAPRSAIDLEAQHWSRIFAGNEILDVSAQELDPLWCGSPTLFSCSLCGEKNFIFYSSAYLSLADSASSLHQVSNRERSLIHSSVQSSQRAIFPEITKMQWNIEKLLHSGIW
jgi:hypothetical protein